MSSKKSLVFIHGWGLGPTVWHRFISTYFNEYPTSCIDLFCHPSTVVKPNTWHKQWCRIADGLQQDSVIIAWSMGGLVGIDLARYCQKKIKALILLNSIPCFFASNDWIYGIDQRQIESLTKAVQSDADEALKYFCGLVMHGDQKRHHRTRQLRQLAADQQINKQTLLYWLQLLSRLDLRAAYSSLTLPLHLLLSRQDAIIDVDVGALLQQLNPAGKITLLQAASHASFLSRPAAVAAFIRSAL